MAQYHLPSSLEKICLLQLFLLISLISAQDATILVGPLPTTFTPPVTCNSITAIIDSWTPNNNVATTETLLNAGANDWVPNYNCLPPGYNFTLGAAQYYSPGICPSGWYMALGMTSTEADFRPKNAAVPVETIGICCPTGYNFDENACTSNLISSTIAAAYWYGNGAAGTITLTTETTAVGSNTVYAILIEVRWQASDIIGSQTSSVSQTSRSQTSSGIQPNSTSSIHPSTLSHGLSGGAKIGIGLGIPLAFLLLTGLLASVYVRKFSQSRQERVSGEPISELHVISELDGTPIHPVSGSGQDLTSVAPGHLSPAPAPAPAQEAIPLRNNLPRLVHSTQRVRQSIRRPDVQTDTDESSAPSPLIKPV